MKASVLILFSMIICTISCNNSPSQELKLYKCACEEIPNLGDSTQVVQKVKYIYLVKSKELPTCCDEPVETRYTGYKEIWENEAPNHPTVWGRSTSNLSKLDGAEAQSLGCALKDKNVTVVDMEKYPLNAKEYYPELVE